MSAEKLEYSQCATSDSLCTVDQGLLTKPYWLITLVVLCIVSTISNLKDYSLHNISPRAFYFILCTWPGSLYNYKIIQSWVMQLSCGLNSILKPFY